MTIFLGYDPGGRDNHGIAAVDIDDSGKFRKEPDTRTLRDANKVEAWLKGQHCGTAIGIDTLLAWSRLGNRRCDRWLRNQYPQHRESVVAQNSLFSAMTINGIIVAKTANELGLFLVETHPKLFRKSELENDNDAEQLREEVDKLDDRSDHETDALIAAWCASRWYFKRWEMNLYDQVDEDLIFPVGSPVYPWPSSACTEG